MNVLAKACPNIIAMKIPPSPYFKMCLKAYLFSRKSITFIKPDNIVAIKTSMTVIIVMSINVSPNLFIYVTKKIKILKVSQWIAANESVFAMAGYSVFRHADTEAD